MLPNLSLLSLNEHDAASADEEDDWLEKEVAGACIGTVRTRSKTKWNRVRTAAMRKGENLPRPPPPPPLRRTNSARARDGLPTPALRRTRSLTSPDDDVLGPMPLWPLQRLSFAYYDASNPNGLTFPGEPPNEIGYSESPFKVFYLNKAPPREDVIRRLEAKELNCAYTFSMRDMVRTGRQFVACFQHSIDPELPETQRLVGMMAIDAFQIKRWHDYVRTLIISGQQAMFEKTIRDDDEREEAEARMVLCMQENAGDLADEDDPQALRLRRFCLHSEGLSRFHVSYVCTANEGKLKGDDDHIPGILRGMQRTLERALYRLYVRDLVNELTYDYKLARAFELVMSHAVITLESVDYARPHYRALGYTNEPWKKTGGRPSQSFFKNGLDWFAWQTPAEGRAGAA